MRFFLATIFALICAPLPSSADDWEAGLLSLTMAAKDMPRGSTDIPAQWFLMKSVIGWEEMMLVFGYAENKSACEHLVKIAKVDAPAREFACLDAN